MHMSDVDKIHPPSEKIYSHDRLKSPASAFRINQCLYHEYTDMYTHHFFLLKVIPTAQYLSSNVVFHIQKSIPSFRDSLAKRTILLWNKVVLVIFPLQDICAFFSLHQGESRNLFIQA